MTYLLASGYTVLVPWIFSHRPQNMCRSLQTVISCAATTMTLQVQGIEQSMPIEDSNIKTAMLLGGYFQGI
ncbi:MAG: hypothetical protein U5M23_01145 [Marinagarivorans sp.]|nr:hypothetical protein [Marinagarivorans sp.]